MLVPGDVPASSQLTDTVSERAASAAGASDADVCHVPGSNNPSLSRLLRQLAASANFRVFTGVSVLQSLDCAFEKNFFVPLMDALLPALLTAGVAGGHGTPPLLRGAVISLSFLLPHVCVVAGWTPLLRVAGLPATLRVVMGSRATLLAAALALSWSWAVVTGVVREAGHPSAQAGGGGGAGSPWAPRGVLLFLLLNRVLSESVCRLFPLIKAELVDEDAQVHRRAHGAVSASVMGAAEALAKTGQSLAPMLAYAVLPQLQQLGGAGGPGGGGGGWASRVMAGGGGAREALLRALAALGGSPASSATMGDAAWGLLLGVPLLTVALQAALWRGYRSRDSLRPG